MHTQRTRAGTRSSRRAVQALALGLAVAVACALAAPAVALATQNTDVVDLASVSAFVNTKKIVFDAARFVENAEEDPVRVTATESEDQRSVTIRDVSNAPGGFVAVAPCEKTEAQTAVCPMQDAEGHAVSLIEAAGAFAGNNELAVDTPTLLAYVLGGRGNDTISIAHAAIERFQSTAAILQGEGGEDTLTGGSGLDTFYADQGNDTVFAFNEPAKADKVFCPNGSESPGGTAHLDSLDVVEGVCARVIRGP